MRLRPVPDILIVRVVSNRRFIAMSAYCSRQLTESPLRRLATETLRRARRLPVGADRNELRQRAISLRWLEKHGMAEKALATMAAERSALKD